MCKRDWCFCDPIGRGGQKSWKIFANFFKKIWGLAGQEEPILKGRMPDGIADCGAAGDFGKACAAVKGKGSVVVRASDQGLGALPSIVQHEATKAAAAEGGKDRQRVDV